MSNTQSGKLRRARNIFVTTLIMGMSASTAGTPANAQTALTMEPIEPTVVKQCIFAGNTYAPNYKYWACQHCMVMPILGAVCGKTFIEVGTTWYP